MKLVDARFLDDGKAYNHGQPCTLIELERPEDAGALLENILRTGYYDGAYFAAHSGYERGKLVPNFWFIAELARALHPRRVLEVGCGRGDVLHLLQRSGVEVAGVDFSADACAQAWPGLEGKLEHGELSQVCAKRAQPVDLLLGFDIWEHLLPERLDASIAAAVANLTEDGLAYFVVPAFGRDDVFGEPFPLEFELNRAAHEAHQPYRYLRAERLDPPIPASGHLIWADTTWWEARFAAHGLVRLRALERELHGFFDPLLVESNRSFYFFRRDTQAANARAEALRGTYSWARLARCVAGFGYATRVTKELRGGLARHLVATKLPPGVRALYRRARELVLGR